MKVSENLCKGKGKGSCWPWSGRVNPENYESSFLWPKISIVTPSFNQGKFIEETIRSVLLQNYPNLEFIIIDGGSKDETTEIIKKYDKQISYWVSEPDEGQADALNKGLGMATGDIIGWLNSDDYYCPLTLLKVANELRGRDLGLLYGNASYYHEDNSKFSFIDVVQRKKQYHLPFDIGWIQPATFWTRKLWETVGCLKNELNYGFDWEWFLRACKVGDVLPCDEELAIYRLHKDHKTGKGGEERAKELLCILRDNGFVNYANTIERYRPYAGIIKKVVNVTTRYRIGNAIYGSVRLVDRKSRQFSPKEVAEIFNKVVGIFGF